MKHGGSSGFEHDSFSPLPDNKIDLCCHIWPGTGEHDTPELGIDIKKKVIFRVMSEFLSVTVEYNIFCHKLC